MLTPTIADGIKDWLNEHPADKVKEAIKEAVMAGVRKPSYINAILESWKLEGYKKTPKRGPPGINDPKLQHILDDVEAA